MRRVLVARLDSMGDVLLGGPAVRAVASQAPVVMLCGPRGADAARMLPGVERVLVWDAPWISNPAPTMDEEHLAELLRLVRAADVDEAVILTSFHQSPLPLALALRLAGVARIAGASVDYPGSLLDVRLRPGEDLAEDIPEPERALAIAAAAGFPLPERDDARMRVRDVPDMTDVLGREPFVVLHPGAAVPARTWPVERYAETAAALAAQGTRVVLTGSSAERGLTSRIRAAAPGALDLAGRCDLPQLAGVLAAAQVVVVGNTGPAHLAVAVGTPIVSLFAPVVPSIRWGPYLVPSVVLGDQDAPCRNSRARECPIPGHPCLTGVSAAEVLRSVNHLSGEGGAARLRR
ncbi:glycosyltransferase family 9 protein [Pseudoclavibacter terrae]|uniref:glycosyltransferase family 9 protein n=1 Tax=Pseudoclavibacter terrae TaxID=1530195 RepID=UPI00232F2185|nr:glycosyltransferase family 9 protein [Pseudoclavibacter terrae]